MAKVNFRQAKRQKELARKQRQDEKLLRRGERAAADAVTDPTTLPTLDTPIDPTPDPTIDPTSAAPRPASGPT